ncbi:MAG TPA: hypothetical protein VGN02_06950 [Paenibacillus sp.]|jgi:hypothetical protein
MATITLTTGPVLNGSETGVRASIVRVLISNDDTTPVTYELEVFSIPDTAKNTPKIPFVHQLFEVGALTSTNVNIPIFQIPIYEVQLQVTSNHPEDTITTVVGVDAEGKIVDSLQIFNSDLSQIRELTPVP